MRRVVFDTNLITSGVVGIRRDESTPGALLRRWFERRLTLVMSEHLLAEIERALAKPYFVAHTTPADRALVLSTLREQATWTDVTTVVAGVATHLEDTIWCSLRHSQLTLSTWLRAIRRYSGCIAIKRSRSSVHASSSRCSMNR